MDTGAAKAAGCRLTKWASGSPSTLELVFFEFPSSSVTLSTSKMPRPPSTLRMSGTGPASSPEIAPKKPRISPQISAGSFPGKRSLTVHCVGWLAEDSFFWLHRMICRSCPLPAGCGQSPAWIPQSSPGVFGQYPTIIETSPHSCTL